MVSQGQLPDLGMSHSAANLARFLIDKICQLLLVPGEGVQILSRIHTFKENTLNFQVQLYKSLAEFRKALVVLGTWLVQS